MTLTDKAKAILSFGSDKDLRALGKLTLIFSMVDELLADRAGVLAAMMAAGASAPVTVKREIKKRAQKERFADKVRILRCAITSIADHFAIPTQASTKELLKILGKVSKLAQHRADLIHGWLSWDSETARPVFRNKGVTQVASAREIEALNDKLLRFASDFHTVFARWLLELKDSAETIEN